jgi:hypothetical protein
MVASADTLLRTVDRRLSELLALEDDWDSYGGKPPSATAILLAGRLTQRAYDRYGELLGEAALPSSISPLAYGGVELEWEGTDTLLALDVGPEGNLGTMLKRGTGQDAVYEEAEDFDWDDALERMGKVFTFDRSGSHHPVQLASSCCTTKLTPAGTPPRADDESRRFHRV